MNLAIFRERIRYYLTLVDKNQRSLAVALHMHPNVLSRKLNNTNKAIFSHSEIKELVKVLILWGSLNYREEVTELLDLIGFKSAGFFTPGEWHQPPFNTLEDGYFQAPTRQSSDTKSGLARLNPQTSDLDQVESAITYSQLSTPKSNLPQSTSSFIGREREISDLVGKVTSDAVPRLLTLVGVGGTGKTRLALEVAAKLLPHFKDGIFFLGLETVTERTILISELMSILGINSSSDKSLPDTLKKYLSSRQLFLVMDNFEQLVENGATLLPELLRAAPQLKILVTSRFPLQLSVEHEYRVDAFRFPTLEEMKTDLDLVQLEKYPAIALFTVRAQAVKPDFTITTENKWVIAEICRKLDGLPLALELAAARLRAFPPRVLLERLSLRLLRGGARDLPVRQQTLRATIEWSYDLLSKEEQVFFAYLSIFAGGFTLEAAEAVCHFGNEEKYRITPLEGIESLLLKNLIRQWEDQSGATRYGMLQTIGEFGKEKLKERGDWFKLSQHYASYYLKKVQKLESQMKSKDQIAAFMTLDGEYDNLRMILSTGLKEGESETTQFAIELAISLEFFWDQHNHLAEGREYLELALALTEDHNFKHVMLLNRLGNLIWRQGDYLTARSYFEAALILSRQSGDKFETALSLHGLALILYEQVSFAESLSFYQESLLLRRELGDKYGLCRILINLGEGYLEVCNYEKALHYLEESLEVGRQLGNKRSISHAFMGLGRVTGDGYRDYKTGRKFFEEALIISQEIGDNYINCGARIGLGAMALYQREYDIAEQFLTSALVISRETRENRLTGYALNLLGKLALEQQDFANSRRYYEEGLLLWGEMSAKGRAAEILTGLSLLRSLQSDSLEAQHYTAHLGGAINTLLTSTSSIINLSLKDKYEKALETARLSLGTEEFNKAFIHGSDMSLEEAVNYTLTWKSPDF